MHVLLLFAAAVWGAATGLLIPRAAYRLSVQPDEPWRAACPAGHPITGPLGGWLGRARCTGGPVGERCAYGAGGPLSDAADATGVPDGTPSAAAFDGTPSDPVDGSASSAVAYTASPLPAAASTAPDSTAPTVRGAAASTAPDETVRTVRDAAASTAPDSTAPTVRGAAASTAPEDTARHPTHLSAVRRHPRYGPRTSPVAAVTALLCLALAAATGARPELVVWLLAAPVAVLLALVDRAVHRLPDVLTLPLIAGFAALLGAAALLPGHRGSWPGALLGGLVLGAGYFLLCLIYPEGMGLGDAKLALALGAALGWYGWTVLFIGFLAGLVLGFCYGTGLMVLRRADRKTTIPLGPFMLGGAFLGLLVGALGA